MKTPKLRSEVVLCLQAKELQTLHNLRKLFVQDLATRVKKVKHIVHNHSSPFDRVLDNRLGNIFRTGPVGAE